MAKLWAAFGEPISEQELLGEPTALSPRRQAVATRKRRDRRLARVASTSRACPVVAVERDGRTVWRPRCLAEPEPADGAA